MRNVLIKHRGIIEMSGLLIPKRVFFDTRDLVYMKNVAGRGPSSALSTEQRRGYSNLLKAIDDGLIWPVICLHQPVEWLNDDGAGEAYAIAQVLDRTDDLYYVLDHVLVFCIEAANEAVRLAPSGVAVPSPIIRIGTENIAIRFLAENVAMMKAHYDALGLAGATAAYADARAIVRSVDDPAQRALGPTAQEQHDLFQSALKRSFDEMPRLRSHPEQTAVEWLLNVPMVRELVAALGVSNLDEFRAAFDLNNCPALRLWSRFWWRFAKAKEAAQKGIERTDPPDITYLAAYVYADYSLAERRMTSFIRQADNEMATRAFSNPSELLAELERHLPTQ